MDNSIQIFEDIFDSRCSGCYRQCSCGIKHYDISENHWDWEDGELEGLIAQSKIDPEICIAHDCAIGTICVMGHEIVIGCTCDTAGKIKSLFDSHRDRVIEYYKRVTKEKTKDVMKETESLKGL